MRQGLTLRLELTVCLETSRYLSGPKETLQWCLLAYKIQADLQALPGSQVPVVVTPELLILERLQCCTDSTVCLCVPCQRLPLSPAQASRICRQLVSVLHPPAAAWADSPSPRVTMTGPIIRTHSLCLCVCKNQNSCWKELQVPILETSEKKQAQGRPWKK